jgi:hypothetical protein
MFMKAAAILGVLLLVVVGVSPVQGSPVQGSPVRLRLAETTTDVHPSKFAGCAGLATTVSTAALACLEDPPNAVAAEPVSLKFHFDPTLHPDAAKRIREVAAWALPYYNGYFTRLKRPASIHIVFSLSPSWCGQIVSKFDYGSPTPTQTEQSYLCVQDGGANAGHSRSRSSSFVVVRPPSEQRDDFQLGTGEFSDEFYYSLVAAEMGHASRSLMMEAYTGERGGQPYWPIWAQYMGNEVLRYLADLETGTSVEDARADRVWWMCERRPTWRADYNDKRLTSWETGFGGIYGCPGGPVNQSNFDTPNHYNMAFMAGEYLVAKHGLRWVLETFMSAPLKTRSGPGVRNLKKAALSLGYQRWRQIERELNANMRTVLAEYGAALPE